MKNKVLPLLTILMISAAPAIAADQTLNGVQIKKVVPNGNGIMLEFTSRPSACSGSYKGMHAFLNGKTDGFSDHYARISFAKITGEKIKISYKDVGDCKSESKLLQLSGVE